MTEPSIIFDEVSVHFGRVAALNGVSFEVRKRSVFALIGPNGAGKSTLLHAIINQVAPQSGRITILEKDSRRLRARDLARIGFVADGQRFPDWMTGAAYLEHCAAFYPSWDGELLRRMAKVLAVPQHTKISRLSRGERMKLSLLAAMSYRPEILILDEPFSGLDPLARDDLISALLGFVGEHDWTVLLSSHDVEEVENLSDHVGFLANGKMALSESVESLQKRFRSVEVRLEETVPARPREANWMLPEWSEGLLTFIDPSFSEAGVRESLKQLGYRVRHCQFHPMSLREIFIALAKEERRTADASPVPNEPKPVN